MQHHDIGCNRSLRSPPLGRVATLVALLGLALVATTSSSVFVSAAMATVGALEPRVFSIDTTLTRTPVSETFTSPGSTFISVHFAAFALAAGDQVVVRSPDGRYAFAYEGLGRGGLGNQPDGFFASRIPGDTAIVDFKPTSASASSITSERFGFRVDQIARTARGGHVLTVCGTDDTRPARCYADSEPALYGLSRAVARLLIKGQTSCTGWLVGSEGHLLSNYHCIGKPDAALQTDVEFGAESASCDDECRTKGGCPGKVVASTATIIASDEALDYALVKLNTTVDLAPYGHLRLRVAGATLKERIFVPQHPGGFAKRLAMVVDDGSPARIDGVDASNACGGHRIAYGADTEPGASGSPVLATNDSAVVALHSCGVLSQPCINTGTDIRAIIWDLRRLGVVPRDALDDPQAPVPEGPWIPGASAAPTPPPSPVPTQSVCRIFRQETSCLNTIPGRCVWVNGVCLPKDNVTPAPTTTPPPTPTTPTTTTPAPTTPNPTTPAPTTPQPTTPKPTTPKPTTPKPTTPKPTTTKPSTPKPTTPKPTTTKPTTPKPTTPKPTTPKPTTPKPTATNPTTPKPTTPKPTTTKPTTLKPTPRSMAAPLCRLLSSSRRLCDFLADYCTWDNQQCDGRY